MFFSNYWNSEKFLKYGIRIVGFVAIVSFGINGYFETQFLNYPMNPDPTTGRIVLHIVKGAVRFISESEIRTIQVTMFLGVISAAMGFAFISRYLYIKKRMIFQSSHSHAEVTGPSSPRSPD